MEKEWNSIGYRRRNVQEAGGIEEWLESGKTFGGDEIVSSIR